jgi:hypothetical protein
MEAWIIVGAIFAIAIACSSLWNKDDLARYQALKNKRRFSGKRLQPDELAELDRLTRKYWWY